MNYHNITYPDMNNGDGLRVVLWLSGCSHKCKGCQNPQTWNPDSGILFDENAKEELFRELDKDYISGLTLSGGDPLNTNNLNGVLEIIIEFKSRYPNKTIWLYTGFNFNEIIRNFEKRKQIVSLCNVIVDGEYIEAQRDVTLKWRGSNNQRVIDIKKSLNQNQVVLYCD